MFNYKEILYIQYSLLGKERFKAHNLFVCCVRFAIRMIGYLIRSPFSYKSVNEVLVVIPSSNNKRSTQPILDAMHHKSYTCVERFYDFLPMGGIYLKSIIKSQDFWKLYFSASKEEREMMRSVFDKFASARELYDAVGKFYDANPQIRLLIVSNDHFPIIRTFIKQAQNHGVKTIYSQHASVSEFFPPLTFDFSFLDGKESFMKYKSISNICGDVFLIGSPRFDIITQMKRQESNVIGIAFNEMDDNNKIISLINILEDNGFKHIVVRPHPRQDKNNPDWSIFTTLGCEISHPLQENPFKFISRLSFLIAGASSIHLDAALLRTPSAIFNLQLYDGDLDYYGYARTGLTPIVKTAYDLVQLIKAPYLPKTEIIRYYDAAYGTEYDGKSASLAARFIDAYLDGNEQVVLNALFEKKKEGYYAIKN